MRTSHDVQCPVIPTPTNCQAYCCDTTGLLCVSCQYGKGAQTSTGAKHVVEMNLGVLCANELTPRKMLSLTNMSPRSRNNCLTPKARKVQHIRTLGALSFITMPPS
eukprot:3914742-Ditylum_brightwellii.AAC.1